MKKIYRIILISLVVIGASCTDLEVTPQNAFGASDLFDDPNAYRQYLAKLYGAFSLTGQDGPHGKGDISIVNDEGFTSYIRAYWKAQELTTDEAVIGWTDAGVRDLHAHIWSSENQFVRVIYYRIFYIIAYSNDFLFQSEPGQLDSHGISDADRAIIEVYRAEARFLRAMAYWHALDLFRNVPLLTSISGGLPVQSSPAEIFDFIETELNDIESTLVSPKSNEYGRVDQAALWMLQAKLYLNAEIYINEPKYGEVITACNKVFGAGYSLNTDYKTLFMADNHTSNEIIYALNSDGKNTKNWGSTTFLVHGAIGEYMVDKILDGTENDPAPTAYSTEDIDLYGVSGGWGGMRTTQTMIEKFYNNTNNMDLDNPDDPRGIFYSNGQSLEINEIGQFQDGIAVPKFSNLTSAGVPGSDVTHVDTDYPLFRLADAYLMYAEAVLRGGAGGDMGSALGYVNDLRERAYGDNSGNVASIDLDFILDERVREMYWEGTRRVDLIRYGRFSDTGIWPWKGDVKEGKTTESFRDYFPIPASDLIANPNLTQSDGY